MSPAYSFRTTWTVPHPRQAVHGLLVDLEHYPSWWPQVLAVARVTDDDARVLCRSALPYTLDLLLGAVHRDPHLLETRISGDLEGVARWRLHEQCEAVTRMEYEQDVRVPGRWLGAASAVLRPVFRWNHDQMMAGCHRGLRARLAG